jgi:hypothetical protein
MANEAKYVYGSPVTLEANGAGTATTAFAQADDASLASANTGDYPLADFVLYAAFGANVAAGASINLYRCDQAIDGANNAPAPGTGYKFTFVGLFPLSSTASAGAYYPLKDVPLSKTAYFYIENNTAQSLSGGWTLKATPKTMAPT